MKDITSMRYIPTKEQFKARTTSVKAWRLPKQKSALAPEHVWTNEDMDPVKIENQTWTLWTWMAYWATDTINLGTWETASSILAVGLSWREAIPIVSMKMAHFEDIRTDLLLRSLLAHLV
jgi:NCS1 family nucleobase:cation symporter-1